MKKCSAFLFAIVMLLSLTACGTNVCKENGCNDETYQDGYCKYHYAVHSAKDAIDGAAKDLFNGFFGE